MIREYMTIDHRECDKVFSILEEMISKEKDDVKFEKFREFEKMMLDHFKMEEEVLFLKIEESVGKIPPVFVMLEEHKMIKKLLSDIKNTIEAGNLKSFHGLAETLMLYIQQHNMKEEQILYQLAENVLKDKNEEILVSMKKHVGR